MERDLLEDRSHAGRELAGALSEHRGLRDGLVLALPRGGVPVAYEIARALKLPLDIFSVRKLGVPGRPELAMGAIASGGWCHLNERVVRDYGISDESIQAAIAMESEELRRRERVFRGDFPPLRLEGREIILVDDGLATGATMQVAVKAIRSHNPGYLIAAVPVASRTSLNEIKLAVDEFICLRSPKYFRAVGDWYLDFDQTWNDEVIRLLAANRAECALSRGAEAAR